MLVQIVVLGAALPGSKRAPESHSLPLQKTGPVQFSSVIRSCHDLLSAAGTPHFALPWSVC